MADLRYRCISDNYAGSLKRARRKEGLSKSDRIDRVLTHRIWGIPIFLLIMFAVFHLTFSENLLFLGALIPGTASTFPSSARAPSIRPASSWPTVWAG